MQCLGHSRTSANTVPAFSRGFCSLSSLRTWPGLDPTQLHTPNRGRPETVIQIKFPVPRERGREAPVGSIAAGATTGAEETDLKEGGSEFNRPSKGGVPSLGLGSLLGEMRIITPPPGVVNVRWASGQQFLLSQKPLCATPFSVPRTVLGPFLARSDSIFRTMPWV